MANPVMVVREQVTYDTDQKCGRGLWLWCPGCEEIHRPQVAGVDGDLPVGPCWDWDGDVDQPTLSPSFLIQGGSRNIHCHSFIRAGQWEFLTDSAHHLAGQTVPLVSVPDWLVEERS